MQPFPPTYEIWSQMVNLFVWKCEWTTMNTAKTLLSYNLTWADKLPIFFLFLKLVSELISLLFKEALQIYDLKYLYWFVKQTRYEGSGRKNICKKIEHLRLWLKLFHNVEEVIVHLWLVPKLKFNLIQIRQGIFNL